MQTPIHTVFVFESFLVDPDRKTLRFRYSYPTPGTPIEFEEVITLPTAISQDISNEQIRPFLEFMHLMLGISYWKLYCPRSIQIKSATLTHDQAIFWNTVYTMGLGEFFYRNQIDFRPLLKFPFDPNAQSTPSTAFNTTKKALVGIGGGKDSIVTGEILKQHHVPFDGFLLETGIQYPLVRDVAQKMGIKLLIVDRRLDPKLFEEEKQPGSLRGHIPISAVFAAIASFCAAIYGYDSFIVSNEHSANYGNVQYLGKEMNHQWSKSAEFESMFQSYLHQYVTRDIKYFSLLRPLSELAITHLFSKYPAYFFSSSSCNRLFSITKEHPGTFWCGTCAKCAFVFTLLASVLPKETVVSMFHTNVFENATLLPLFRQLLNLEGTKPFDCVGTPQEMIVACAAIRKANTFADTPIMQMIEQEVFSNIQNLTELEQEVFAYYDDSLIPQDTRTIIKDVYQEIQRNAKKII